MFGVEISEPKQLQSLNPRSSATMTRKLGRFSSAAGGNEPILGKYQARKLVSNPSLILILSPKQSVVLEVQSQRQYPKHQVYSKQMVFECISN